MRYDAGATRSSLRAPAGEVRAWRRRARDRHGTGEYDVAVAIPRPSSITQLPRDYQQTDGGPLAGGGGRAACLPTGGADKKLRGAARPARDRRSRLRVFTHARAGGRQ